MSKLPGGPAVGFAITEPLSYGGLIDKMSVKGPKPREAVAPFLHRSGGQQRSRRPAERRAGHAVAVGQRIEAVQALQEDRNEDLQRAVGDGDQQQ